MICASNSVCGEGCISLFWPRLIFCKSSWFFVFFCKHISRGAFHIFCVEDDRFWRQDILRSPVQWQEKEVAKEILEVEQGNRKQGNLSGTGVWTARTVLQMQFAFLQFLQCFRSMLNEQVCGLLFILSRTLFLPSSFFWMVKNTVVEIYWNYIAWSQVLGLSFEHRLWWWLWQTIWTQQHSWQPQKNRLSFRFFHEAHERCAKPEVQSPMMPMVVTSRSWHGCTGWWCGDET